MIELLMNRVELIEANVEIAVMSNFSLRYKDFKIRHKASLCGKGLNEKALSCLHQNNLVSSKY